MSTAAWREDKSEHMTQELCYLLTIDGLSQEVRSGIEAALWDSLKLLADSIESRFDDSHNRWSPALVGVFRDNPEKCNEWLKLMAEENFSAEDYWSS